MVELQQIDFKGQYNSDFQSFYNKNRGKHAFGITQAKSLYYFCITEELHVNCEWAALYSTEYVILGRTVSRCEFLDNLRNKYQEYFEWFLFHPEYLR